MAKVVLRTRSAGRAVEQLTKPARLRYDSAVAALRGRGCEAGGYRLIATSGEDYPMCCRPFYRPWRMQLVFPDPATIVIIAVGQHTQQEDPHAALAEIFPGLSRKGRRRSAKPACCEKGNGPPLMSDDLRAAVNALFGR